MRDACVLTGSTQPLTGCSYFNTLNTANTCHLRSVQLKNKLFLDNTALGGGKKQSVRTGTVSLPPWSPALGKNHKTPNTQMS